MWQFLAGVQEYIFQECSGSVCLAHGREPCFCSPIAPGNTKDEKLCQVCCVDGAGDCR